MKTPAQVHFDWKLSVIPENIAEYVLVPGLTFAHFMAHGFIRWTIGDPARGIKPAPRGEAEARFDWSLVEQFRAQRAAAYPAISPTAAVTRKAC